MNRRTRSRLLIAGTAILSLVVGTTPASAQFGGVVFDPSNYAQNVLTAARSLQQINNQITSLQNQAQSLINQARNLTSLPTNALSGIQQSIDRTRQLIAQAQAIAYNVQDIDRVFAARYPSGSLSGTSSAQLVAKCRDALARCGRLVPGFAAHAGDDRYQHRRYAVAGRHVGQREPDRDRCASSGAGRQPARRAADPSTRRFDRADRCAIARGKSRCRARDGRRGAGARTDQALPGARLGGYVARSVSLFHD